MLFSPQKQSETPEKKEDKTQETTPVKKVEIKSAPVDQVDSTPKEKDIKQQTNEVSSTQEVQDTQKEVQKPVESKTEPKETIPETKTKETEPETLKTGEVKKETPVATEIKTETKVEPLQEPIQQVEAPAANTEPEQVTDEPIVNGHDENKSAFQGNVDYSSWNRFGAEFLWGLEILWFSFTYIVSLNDCLVGS